MNISETGLSTNGQPMTYSEPLKLHFGDLDYSEHIMAYHALFTGSDIKCADCGNNISCDEFANGYSIFTFNLSPNSETGEHHNLLRRGILHLVVQFSKSVSKTTQVLIFGGFQSVIELDRYTAVFSDRD